MTLDWTLVVQATVSVWVLVGPLSRGVFFRMLTEGRSAEERRKGALIVLVTVSAILYTSAIVGRELLELLGINLGAFGVVGGLVVALMGFEMLYGGQSSRAQGTKEAEEEDAEEEGLVIPLAVPLMAGPGAITTIVTISTLSDDGTSVIAALVGVAVVSVLVFVGFAFLGDLISRLSASATAMLARIGGILLATIGTQLLLGGIRTFYEF